MGRPIIQLSYPNPDPQPQQLQAGRVNIGFFGEHLTQTRLNTHRVRIPSGSARPMNTLNINATCLILLWKTLGEYTLSIFDPFLTTVRVMWFSHMKVCSMYACMYICTSRYREPWLTLTARQSLDYTYWRQLDSMTRLLKRRRFENQDKEPRADELKPFLHALHCLDLKVDSKT